MKLTTNSLSWYVFNWLVALLLLVSVSSAFAVPRCGSFEMIEMPVRSITIVPFSDGTLTGIGMSSANPAIPVVFYYDGSQWAESAMPAELDGFAFTAASARDPSGGAWFAATKAFSVYEIEVAFVYAVGGEITDVHKLRSSTGAPLDISAPSVTDVWAASRDGDVFHFDGNKWSVIDVPDVIPGQHINPKSVYAVSSNDVWLAGYVSPGKLTDHGYVQHWDGSSWRVVSTPYDNETSWHFFNDMDGSGADDIWIVGEGSVTGPILMHWNGSEWSVRNNAVSDNTFAKVLAMAPANAWAVPIQSSSLYYWDGSQWAATEGFAFPNAANTISMRSIAKAGACDAWAVGDYHDGIAWHAWGARLVEGDVVSPPPPPPPVDVTKVFVASGIVTRNEVARRTFNATASVTVRDSNGNAVSGARVSGSFSGPSNESKTAVTGSDGKAYLTSTTIYRPSGSWCFAVSGVQVDGATYDGSLNAVSTVCEAGGADSGSDGGKGGKKTRR